MVECIGFEFKFDLNSIRFECGLSLFEKEERKKKTAQQPSQPAQASSARPSPLSSFPRPRPQQLGPAEPHVRPAPSARTQPSTRPPPTAQSSTSLPLAHARFPRPDTSTPHVSARFPTPVRVRALSLPSRPRLSVSQPAPALAPLTALPHLSALPSPFPFFLPAPDLLCLLDHRSPASPLRRGPPRPCRTHQPAAPVLACLLEAARRARDLAG